MKLSNFFIWCAGSDTDLLAHCSQKERNKHVGFGTLVLVPAVLALISMSFALSTIEVINDYPLLYFLGGLIWALIIFSFDRFIVSTHIRKMSNKKELKNPAFFLRLGFALILGIVISHPLVMFYFDGSINDQITQNMVTEKENIQNKYDLRIEALDLQLNQLDSIEQQKVNERNDQAEVVAKEIDGEVIKNAKGQVVTTGLYGKGPSAENKIKQLSILEQELAILRNDQAKQKKALTIEIDSIKKEQSAAIAAFSVSYDYLNKEMALEQLKENNAIVRWTQYFLILLFVLVDILPFIFKTFSPFGMYDRILHDDELLVRELDNKSRRVYLEQVYQQINEI